MISLDVATARSRAGRWGSVIYFARYVRCITVGYLVQSAACKGGWEVTGIYVG